MNKGIYLVANLKSQDMCKNLIYSIRKSNCTLPIRLIHFGGKKISSSYILGQVECLYYENFPEEAKKLITDLQGVLPFCPAGFLYRYLAWFADWDEFIYSDNDIVALSNWSDLFEKLANHDLVHADEEYTTDGFYNYDKPEMVRAIFGSSSLESAITAGHFIVKKNKQMITDINHAIEWFRQNPDIPKKHDQSLMHIASLLGNWNILNLCKSEGWLSSWAGDYNNSLHLIQAIQTKNTKISHIHYSGGNPKGDEAIQELLFSDLDYHERIKRLYFVAVKSLSGYDNFIKQYLRVVRYCRRKLIRTN